MTAKIIPGAEPYSANGGPDGVLVLHGFTGNPQSMRGLASRFAGAGYSVELPRLPGHGTALADMVPTRWADWSEAADAAYEELTRRCSRVVVAALSMGGSLAAWLAIRHPEIAGLVLVNPFIDPPAQSFRDVLSGALDSGTETIAGIGSDIADPNSKELSYEATPVAALLSLCAALDEFAGRLSEIRCPILLFTSSQDHVVPPVSSDVLASAVSGPVERVILERSFHVATLDYDRDLIESRATDWVSKLLVAAAR